MAGQPAKSIQRRIKPIAPPVDTDDDIELVIKKDANAGAQAGINFIKSAFALNGMVYDGKQ